MTLRRALGPALLLPASILALGCFSSQYRTKPRVAEVGGDPVVQMTEPEKLRSLDGPTMEPLERQTHPPGGEEPVVGLFQDGQARAYALGLLARYEIVNDRSADLPYVVTRCPLTEIIAVYDRRVAGRTLTFINSGALWRDTLVLQDRETGTLWTSATGRALAGPLEGSQLKAIPARVTTVESWRNAFPSSLYLDTGEVASMPLGMRLYGLSDWQGFSGAKTADARFKAKEAVFAISSGNEAIGFSAADLARKGRVDVELAGRRVELIWDARFATPRAFDDEEIAVTPMYWFALDRHFNVVRTLAQAAAPEAAAVSRRSP
jgi:hypothetical protein